MSDTFNAIVVSKADFDEYNLSPKDFEKVWEYAQRKIGDILMQDWQLAVDMCVEGALND